MQAPIGKEDSETHEHSKDGKEHSCDVRTLPLQLNTNLRVLQAIHDDFDDELVVLIVVHDQLLLPLQVCED